MMRDLPFRRRGCYIENNTFFPDSRPGARPAVPPSVGAGESPGITFGGFAQPSSDFQSVRDQRRTLPLWFLVDLSTARSIAAGSAAVLNLQGNAFYADPLQDASGLNIAGYATVHFSDTSLNPQGTPITVGPQFIARVPFTQLLVENIAQAGKFLRIIYGVDIDFSPGLNASVTIGGVVLTTPVPAGYGAAFASTTALVANTPENIVSAAANTAGLRLWRAGASGYNATTLSPIALLSKATAPATIIDGDVHAGIVHQGLIGASFFSISRLQDGLTVASGKRLDTITTITETGGSHRYAEYTIV